MPPVNRPTLIDVLEIRIDILDTNVAPEFTEPSRAHTHQEVSEAVDVGACAIHL